MCGTGQGVLERIVDQETSAQSVSDLRRYQSMISIGSRVGAKSCWTHSSFTPLLGGCSRCGIRILHGHKRASEVQALEH